MGLAAEFKLSIYLLTAFTGVVLGFAEWGWIPFVSFPMTMLAYYRSEIRRGRGGTGTRGLSENTAFGLGIVSLGAAAIEFFGGNPEGRLLAGIHLVVYLTWVVLLQQKTDYRYWLLLALGVLQIAVGAVLTNATWYGLCLIVYLFAAVWTLSIFTLYRAQQEFLGTNATTIRPEQIRSRRDSMGTAINAVRFEGGERWVTLPLTIGVFFNAVAGLGVGTLFFLLIPRVWVGSEFGIPDDALPSALRRTTGLATEVRLGEMRPILESNDPVLRIRLFDHQTGQPIEPQDYANWLGQESPCFRGVVLVQYENNRWRPDRPVSATYTLRLMPKPDDPAITDVVPTVRQEIRLERIGTDTLLCMGRAVAMHDPEGYRCGLTRPASEIAIRRDWFRALPGAVDYIAYSELPSEQARKEPGFSATNQNLVVYRITNHIDRCRELPQGLRSLTDLARRVVATHETHLGRSATDAEKASALVSYLRTSGLFSYSLNATTVDPQLDPIEDFLLNRHAGHCEYFASALALMLRAVDVPSRLVSGFKGGDLQPDGYFYVEKRYAHVWVEAWISSGRKWVTLDATPEDGRAESVTAIGTRRNLWSTVNSQLAGIWESNVLDISYERQEDLLYRPVREWVTAIGSRVREIWNKPQTSLFEFTVFVMNPRNWLTIPGGILLAALVGFLWVLRNKISWLRPSWLQRRVTRVDNHRRSVEFYERFSRLMKRSGHQRGLAQTHDEFVQSMSRHMSQILQDDAMAIRILPISEMFYRVRFGQISLTAEQESAISKLLDQLEQSLNAGTGR